MVESEKNSTTASSFPTALRTLPEHMSNGQSLGIECDVDSEAIAKAYKQELVERMDLFWGQQMREVRVCSVVEREAMCCGSVVDLRCSRECVREREGG